MAILTNSGRVAMAQSVRAQANHLAWAQVARLRHLA